MNDMNTIVQLAVDAYKGRVTNYSIADSQDVLRKALIEANGGSTVLDYKKIRDGKCAGLFSLVETILSNTVVEGLTGDEYFTALVDFRNVKQGDRNIFKVSDNNWFVISDAADGTQGVRRQRLGSMSETSVSTTFKTVRIYEELNRVLSGRVDFNTLITDVAESFRQKLLNDVYALWNGATAAQLGGTEFFPTAGEYDEDALLDVISHVEAAAGGKKASIVCTKKGARKLAPSIQGDNSQDDIYNLGYYGNFYGTPVVVTPQRHKLGTTEFVMDDDVITIIAGDDKPVKVVYEGDSIIIVGDPTTNADLTQEYFYGEKYGMAIVLSGGNDGIGRYELV